MPKDSAITCPVCGEQVLLWFMNVHIEYSCKKNQIPVFLTSTSANVDKSDNKTNPGKLSLKRKRKEVLRKNEEIKTPSKRNIDHVLEKNETLSRKVRKKEDVENKKIVLRNVEKEKIVPSVFEMMESLPETVENTKIVPKAFEMIDILSETVEKKDIVPHVFEMEEIVSQVVDNENIVPVLKNVDTDIENPTNQCYVLEHFILIIQTVLADPNDSSLFNEWDKQILDTFFNLSDDAKKLYVKMYQRKLKWNQVSKVNYPDIETDLNIIVNELNSVELFDTEPNDLNLILEMIGFRELKSLAKELKLNPRLSNTKSKTIEMINKHCRQQRTIFPNSKNLKQIVIQRAKKILGSCFQIEIERRRVFDRILLVFSLTSYCPADKSKMSGNPALFILFSVSSGNAVYPKYTTLKKEKIFRTRDDLISYELFDQAEQDMISLSASKELDALLTLYQSCKENYTIESRISLLHVLALPDYLSQYSSRAALIRCQTIAVEALQRLRRFKEANDLLEVLLDQKFFYVDWRGRWMVRLALNLHKHLNKPKEALTVVIDGLNDENIVGKNRLSLYLRGFKILETKSNQTAEFEVLRKKFHKCQHFLLRDIPTSKIKGRLLPKNNSGQRSAFVSNDDFVCSVEELAIKHYKEEGYTEGLHGETRIFASIFGLLFWDVIYKGGFPDVFRSPYQIYPLDFNTPLFYAQREVEIDEKLHWIGTTSQKNICHTIEEKWKLHFRKLGLVDWDVFTGVEQLQSLLMCVNCDVLSLICGRFAKDYRHNRSGFPDLVVWNEKERKFKVVEVKGPNDKVSPQQMVWLDFLVEIGVDAEICYVSSVGAKKLKKDDSKKLKDDDTTELKVDDATK